MTDGAPQSDVDATARELMGLFHRTGDRGEPPSVIRDLTLGQLRLLFALEREGPQPMGQIADTFDLTSAAASGLVARIERHGLVERRHRQDDRRIVECALTSDGTRLVQGIVGVRTEAVRGALGRLTPTELRTFRRLIGRMHQRMDAR